MYARWARKALDGTLRGRRGAIALGGSTHWCDAAPGAGTAAAPAPAPTCAGTESAPGTGTPAATAGTGSASGTCTDAAPAGRESASGTCTDAAPAGRESAPGTDTHAAPAGRESAPGTCTPAAPAGAGPASGTCTDAVPARAGLAPGTGRHAERPRLLPYRFGDRAGLRLVHGADFVADPLRPVRSDRLDIDEHAAPDRCLLVTPPLPRPLDLLGDAEARLVAAAEGRSADWVVRLVALRPDGRAEPLTTGIVRAEHDGPRPRRLTVPLGHLARRLPAGVRLRVEVAGHHFPAHVRNPHTGDDPVTATRLLPSRRSVRTDGSTLLLPAVHRPAYIDPVQEMLR
ncbi:hypothetical protein J7E93_33655 [Streptomyces sp. ISL-36]|nr:hypothetical protein [Streptomyces sp. ISL-36]